MIYRFMFVKQLGLKIKKKNIYLSTANKYSIVKEKTLLVNCVQWSAKVPDC